MRRAKEAGKPFFTYIATNVPHTDWNVKKEWLQPYNQVGRALAGFYASIERADHNLGRLLRFLNREGLHDSTLLLFLTDNGSVNPSESAPNGGMRGGKTSMYDGGHRVPCFLYGPERIVGEPRAIDELTSIVDLLPTFVELCHLRQPDRSHLPLDGRSLVPLLRDADADWPNRKLFFHHLNMMNQPKKTAPSVVVTPRWRLINREKLYDIESDPDQSDNVAAAHPGVVRRLRRAHDRFWRDSYAANHEPARSVLGPSELRLTPDNSRGGAVWQEEVARGDRSTSGRWPLRVEEAGRYRFEIRRWPRPVDRPFKSGIPAEKPDTKLAYIPPKHTPLPEGKQLPIEKVRISLGNGMTASKSVKDKATHVTFNRKLNSGEFTLEVEFLNDEGERIQGAYYVYAARVE